MPRDAARDAPVGIAYHHTAQQRGGGVIIMPLFPGYDSEELIIIHSQARGLIREERSGDARRRRGSQALHNGYPVDGFD